MNSTAYVTCWGDSSQESESGGNENLSGMKRQARRELMLRKSTHAKWSNVHGDKACSHRM